MSFRARDELSDVDRIAMEHRSDTLIAQRSLTGALAYLGPSFILAFGSDYHRDYPVLVHTLLVVAVLLSALRWGVAWRFASIYRHSPRLWQRLFSFSTLGMAVQWSILSCGSIALYPTEWTSGIAFLSTAAFAGSALLIYSEKLLLVRLYTALVVGSNIATVALVWRPGVVMILAMSVYLVYLWTLGNRLHREGRDAIMNSKLLESRAEELEEARNLADEANRAKGQFLANMSHEIRTPMNGVIGMTSLLMATRLASQQREYVKTIRVSGEALLAVINDILDFSKIESGTLDVERSPFHLRSTIEDSLELVANMASSKGLELAYWIEESSPEAIYGDASRTRQVLVNLLSNAIKFTGSGEVFVSLEARDPPVGAASPGGSDPQPRELHFEVRDTGIGIPESQLPHLFEPFTQVDSSDTRRYGGTGLGLAICKRLTELMGGRIWAESTEDQGTSMHFTILAPAAREEDIQIRTSGDSEHLPADLVVAQSSSSLALNDIDADLVGRRLLIVEENQTHRRILTLQARAWGMETRRFALPDDALEALRQEEPFDAAILSATVDSDPAAAGSRLATAIREHPQGRSLPMILISPMRPRARRPGSLMDFAAVLLKPVKPGELRKALRGVLAPSRPRGSKPNKPPVARVELEPSSTLRILLVEDNLVNQKVAQMMLGRLGYRGDIAANGLEALDALERQPYDVVLMDVQMPEMDGIEATRRIRASDRDGQPLIVGLTAHAMVGDRERCLEAGMDSYLVKPVQISDLQSMLSGAELRANQHLLDETAPIDRQMLELLRRSQRRKAPPND